MFGIKCRTCDGNRCAKPYVTAYEIAVKHGFQGTEEEWIDTLECIYTAKVTFFNDPYWDCSDNYAALVAMSQNKELHLQTLDGKIAFPQGIDGDKVTFCTTTYKTDDGTFYDRYDLYESGDGMYEKVNVSNETGTITLDRLAAGIQTSLGKADTAYQKPPEGIRFEHLQQSVQNDIRVAPIVLINLIDDGGSLVIDEEHTDMHGFNSIPDAIVAGADVRIAYTVSYETGTPYVVHPYVEVTNSGSTIIFAGPEVFTDGDTYTPVMAFYEMYNNDGEITIDRFVRNLPDNS